MSPLPLARFSGSPQNPPCHSFFLLIPEDGPPAVPSPLLIDLLPWVLISLLIPWSGCPLSGIALKEFLHQWRTFFLVWFSKTLPPLSWPVDLRAKLLWFSFAPCRALSLSYGPLVQLHLLRLLPSVSLKFLVCDNSFVAIRLGQRNLALPRYVARWDNFLFALAWDFGLWAFSVVRSFRYGLLSYLFGPFLLLLLPVRESFF